MEYRQLLETSGFQQQPLLENEANRSDSNFPAQKPSCFIIGESSLLIECARLLIQKGYQVKGIISDDLTIQKFAQDVDHPCISTESDFIHVLNQTPFDYLFSIVNPLILHASVLKLPKKLAVNYHDSSLPAYAGVHATFWAVMNQEKTHGITWHTIDSGIDTGNILKQQLFPLAGNETSISLNLKCYEAAIHCFEQLISELLTDTIYSTIQNTKIRTYYPLSNRPKQGYIISWQQSAEEIMAGYRASDFGFHFNPIGLPKIYIEGAYFILSEIAQVQSNAYVIPGTIICINAHEIQVSTLTHTIAIRQLLAFDGTKVSLTEVAEKYKLSEGYCFQDITAIKAEYIEKLNSLCARHQPYWIGKLLNFQPVQLPFTTLQPEPGSKNKCQQVTISISEHVKELISQHAQDWNTSDVLITLFLVYLSRISEHTNVGVGFQSEDLDTLLKETGSFFADTLPLQVVVDSEGSFQQAYKIYSQELLKIASSHTYARDLIPRHPAIYADSERFQQNAIPVFIKKVRNFTEPVISDTQALLFHVSDQSECRFIYNASVWKREDVEAMAHQLEILLLNIINNPVQSLKKISLLTQQEYQKIVFEWNITSTAYPQDKLIHQLFEQQAALSPDAIAIVCADRSLTYEELNHQANQLAGYLQKRGIGSGVMVGICLERSMEMIVGLLAILKAGGAYVPLDMNYPLERLKWMVEETQVSYIVTIEKWVHALPVPTESLILLDSDQEKFSSEPTENVLPTSKASEIAHVLFTSGSTGKPKGVCIPHRGVVRLVKETNYTTLNTDTVMLGMASVAFDASTFEIWGSLTNGGRLVLVPVRNPTLTALKDIIWKEQVNTVLLTTALFHLFVEQGMEELTSLKHLITGGEALSLPHAKKALAQLPNCKIANAYGPTENTVISSFFPITSKSLTHTSVPIGRPISNTQVYILDKHRQPVPIGIPGELYTGGDGLATGYLNTEALTAERFVANPFQAQPDLFLYKTGDRGRYLPDGNIAFMGRLDNQIKIRGFRIEPGEIEAVISQHHQVSEVIVIVPETTPVEKRLVAYIIAKQGVTIPTQALREYLQGKLPDYMIPASFKQVDNFPLTPNGKIDKKNLPLPSDTLKKENTPVFDTSTQKKLVCIWQQLLQATNIALEDHFFEAGGNSLLAMQLVSRIEADFGCQLSIKDVFEFATIGRLSELIESRQQNIAQGSTLIVPLHHTQDPLPLSSGQQRLWFISHLSQIKGTYHVPVVLKLSGNLSIEVLEQSIEEIIKRHHILRTSFIQIHGQPFQQIREVPKVNIPLIEIKEEGTLLAEQKALHIFETDIDQPFDLEGEPLLRIKMASLGKDNHLLLLVFHHIITDGWSINIFKTELHALYTAFLHHQPSPLAELPLQYAAYTNWHLHILQSNSLKTGLAYWKQKLADIPELLPFPIDKPRPGIQTFNGSDLTFTISPTLTRKIKDLSKQSESTLFITLLAIFKVLLHKYTQTRDIVVGTPVANRPHQDLEQLIGFFVNTLVLRTEVLGEYSFRKFLQHVHHTALEAYTHQEVPFEQLVEELNPKRSSAYHPLIQVMFDLENNPIGQWSSPSFHMESVAVSQKTAKFDLHLSFAETTEGLKGKLNYSTDIFTRVTAGRIVSHFQNLVQAIVLDPDQQITLLPLLSAAEQNKILEEWNDTQTEYRGDKQIHRLFEAQVAKTPEAIALSYGYQNLTYAQLNAKANQVAHYLQQSGVGPDSMVGVCMERSLEMVISLYGILKAGGAYVPFDPQYPAHRLAYMIEDTKVLVVLTTQQWKDTCSTSGTQLLLMDTDWHLLQTMPVINPVSEVQPQHLAYVIYTSGSTGQPKGVMNIHSALVNRILWMQQTYQLTPADKVLQKTPFSFDVSVWEFFWPLICGAQLVMAKPGGHKDPLYLKDLIIEEGITTLHFVPSMLQHFVELPEIKDCASLRNVFCSGEALPVALQGRFLDLLPTNLHNLYGPTEAAIDVTYWHCRKDNAFNTVPIGRPIANTQIYILDALKQPVPIGVSGELYIGGANLARGYLNKEALTAERFIWHSFTEGLAVRLYKTGDIARFLSDGNIEYIGRTDEQVKIRGFRIELCEIESVVAQFEEVREVAVVVNQTPHLDKHLVGYVVANTAKQLSIPRIKEFIFGKLPEFMVPNTWVILEKMPLTPSGKIDRKALPVEATSISLQMDWVAPQTPTEKQLAPVWEKVLRVENIGVTDNFFDLGGHSLLTIPLTAEIHTQLGHQFPVATIFAKPTIRELALAIDQGTSDNRWNPLVAIQPTGSKPPIYFIHAVSGEVDYVYKLASYLPSDQPVFGLQAVGINGIDAPHETIEEMAELYLELILAEQKNGVYHLGGYSLGGIIAYEIAIRLKALGKEVGVLAMLDTYPHKPGEFTYLHMPIYSVLHSCWNFLIDSKISLAIKRDVISREVPLFLNHVHDKYKRTFNHRSKTKNTAEKTLNTTENLIKAGFRAYSSYKMKPYPGKVIFFRATESSAKYVKDSDFRWKKHATQGVDIHKLSSDHDSLFKIPSITKYIARTLEMYL